MIGFDASGHIAEETKNARYKNFLKVLSVLADRSVVLSPVAVSSTVLSRQAS